MNGIDHWSQIVKALPGYPRDVTGASRKAADVSGDFNVVPPSSMANVSSIRRIERQTASTLLVSWSDATLGLCQDEIWRAGFARKPGVCGLTGMPVCRGDVVYKPIVRRCAMPRNAFDVFVASTLKFACLPGNVWQSTLSVHALITASHSNARGCDIPKYLR